jgi:hypothetical protein
LVEAGLLTGESLRDTAARAQVDEEVVAAYEAVLFSVRSRLDARDYIALRALPRRASLGVDRGDLAGLLKLAAWTAGPWGLDLAAKVLLNEPAPVQSLASLEDLHDACNEVDCLLWMVLQCLPLPCFQPPNLEVLEKLCQRWATVKREIEALTPITPHPWPDSVVRQLEVMDGAVRQAWCSLKAA